MLWGKVLAGEVKSPGTYSLRTLEFMRSLSQEDAKLIEKIAPLVVDGFIFIGNQQALDETGVVFGELLELQDIGILKGVGGLGLTITPKSVVQGRFLAAFRCHGALLLATHPDAGKAVSLPCCGLTAIGQQVMTLGTSQPNTLLFRALGAWLKQQGYEVSIGRYQQLSDGQLTGVDMQLL